VIDMKYVSVKKNKNCRKIYESIIKYCLCIPKGRVDYCMIPDYMYKRYHIGKCITDITEEEYINNVKDRS